MIKQYYYMDNGDRKGPFTIGELEDKFIFSDTMIIGDGDEEWHRADSKNELMPILRKGFDYRKVEDIAGVDYKKAMIFTAVYIVLNVFFRESAVLGFLGVLLSTTMVTLVWYYFKKYFEGVGDEQTGNGLFWMMGGYILFGIVCLYGANQLSFLNPDAYFDLEKIMGNIGYGILGAIIVVFVASILLLRANKKHLIPLKRIAISSMIFIPIYMIFTFIDSVTAIREMVAVSGDTYEPVVGVVGSIVFMVPYYFIFYHFYRAEVEDATPSVLDKKIKKYI